MNWTSFKRSPLLS